MKKLFVLLSIICLLATGCSVVKLENNIDDIVSTILNDKTKLYNVYFDGYKYYVPKGLKLINKDEYNASFIDRYNNKYYLYVDIISYYHKVEKKYKENSSLFYSKELSYNNKKGYLEIREIDNKYYIQYMYNYVKIEVYTKKNHLSDVLNYSSYLLKSAKYNNKVIDSLIGENKLNYKEESFNIFQTSSKKDNFLNYENEYEKGSSNKKSDEDSIEIYDDSES